MRFTKQQKNRTWTYLIRGVMAACAMLVALLMLYFSNLIDALAEVVELNGSCGRADIGRYEYLSSFIEVMIALNAAGLFDGVRKYFEKRQNTFVSSQVRQICCDRGYAVRDDVAKEVGRVIKPIMQCMRRNAKLNVGISNAMAIGTSFVLTLVLLTNIPTWLRAYMLMAAFPVVMFFTVALVNQTLCRIRLSLACSRIKAPDNPIDDISVLKEIANKSGPKEP